MIKDVPYSLDAFEPGKFQPLMERFEKIFPFALSVLMPEGTLIVGSRSVSPEGCQPLQFQVNRECHSISALRGFDDTAPCALLCAPIWVHDDLIGYVVGDIPLTPEHETLYYAHLQVVAEAVGDKAYNEYELANLTDELLDKYSEITLIYDISEALNAVFDPKEVCDIIINQIVAVVGVERASLMLYDEHQNDLYVMSSYGLGLSAEKIAAIRVAPGEQVSGRVFQTGEPISIDDLDDWEELDLPLSEGTYKRKLFLSIPITFNSMNMERKVMGVINMADKQSSDMFTAGDKRLLSTIASQAAMALYNIQLVEKVKDTERMRREMEIAQQIQLDLLPGEPPRIPGLDLAGRCLPATQVGGDYYDFFRHSEQELGLVIADVSGHDVGSAFVMATARSALRSEVLARKSPARILKDTNLVLYEDLTKTQKFITMFYAEYDGQARILRYANAAQNPPILLRNGTCIPLDTEGFFLGMWESGDFEEKTLQLVPNDFVILYTDGVVEAKNSAGHMFTVQRLTQVIQMTPPHVSAPVLLQTIYNELERFTWKVPRTDDITVVVLKLQEKG